MLGVFLVIFVFAASAAATAVIATRGIGGSGNNAGVEAAVVDIDTTLVDGAAAAGTGIVLTSSGVVLTNNHVVEGWQAISVRLTSTGATFPAILIGQDTTHDIAVLQLQGASGLATAPIGDSSSVQVGDSVTALGNAQGRGVAPVAAPGTVTALGQQITASDQTGAERGEPERDDSDQRPDPAWRLRRPARQRQRPGHRHRHRGERRSQRPRIGRDRGVRDPDRHRAQLRPSDPGATVDATGAGDAWCLRRGQHVTPGALLIAGSDGCATGVASGSPASTTALAAGDVITSLGGMPVVSKSSLTVILQGDHSGQSVIVVWLDTSGREHQAKVTLAAAPPPQ